MMDSNINSPSATSLLPSPEVHPHYENAVRDVLVAEKINTVDILEALKILPKEKSRLNIPLCRMISRPIVRPALQTDVNKLEVDFVHGYRNWEKVFHVSITDEDGNCAFVTPDVSQSWSDNWKSVNDQFKLSLKYDVDLVKFSGKMFFVFDGNHRLQAWKPYIDRLHSDDIKWHYSVDSIILDISSNVPQVLIAMNDVNK